MCGYVLTFNLASCKVKLALSGNTSLLTLWKKAIAFVHDSSPKISKLIEFETN